MWCDEGDVVGSGEGVCGMRVMWRVLVGSGEGVCGVMRVI